LFFAAFCGRCARITGSKGNATVRIVDKCPECLTGALDLHQSAFALLADVTLGRVKVSWQFVSCSSGNGVTGNAQFKFKDGVNDYWVAIQARNHVIGVSKIQIAETGTVTNSTVFDDMTRQDYNYFIRSYSSGIKKPFTVRLVADDGQTIDTVVSAFTASEVKQTSKQFTASNIVTPTSSTGGKTNSAAASTSFTSTLAITVLFIFALVLNVMLL